MYHKMPPYQGKFNIGEEWFATESVKQIEHRDTTFFSKPNEERYQGQIFRYLETALIGAAILQNIHIYYSLVQPEKKGLFSYTNCVQVNSLSVLSDLGCVLVVMFSHHVLSLLRIPSIMSYI